MKKRTRLKNRAQRRCESNRRQKQERAKIRKYTTNPREANSKFTNDGLLILDRDYREIEFIPKTDPRYPNE